MVDVESLLNVEFISDVVKIHPKYVASNMYDIVLKALQEKYENKSTDYGFIRKGSIKLHDIISAQVEYHTLHGYVNVNANFTASVFRPVKDAVMWTKIVDANDFGYKASSFIDGESVLEIIIPRMMSNVKIAGVNVNDIIKVKLLDVKIDHVSHKLSAIGYVVTDVVDEVPVAQDDDEDVAVVNEVEEVDDEFYLETSSSSSDSESEGSDDIVLKDDDDEDDVHDEDEVDDEVEDIEEDEIVVEDEDDGSDDYT